MQSFRNLRVWQKAHSMTLEVYRLTRAFPKEELYGLTSQMRRSACSVGANIAEGCCKSGDRDFGRFLQIAAGSAGELEYHAVLAHDLGLLNPADYQRLLEQAVEVKRMLSSLLKKLRADS
jgi:four helix bundle protein